MEFGLINTFNLIIALILVIPYIMHILKNGNKSKERSKLAFIDLIIFIVALILLIVPIGIQKFGFGSVKEMLIYLFYNIALLVLYIGMWIVYYKQGYPKQAIMLAVIPAVILLLNGAILKHVILMITSMLFGMIHIYVAYWNNK